MTLRYDNHGRPIGLDWEVCNDGNPRPYIWSDFMRIAAGKKPKHPNTIRLGIGRGGNVWMGLEKERQIIDVYEGTEFGPQEIARMFDVTPKTVYRVLNRCGIELRSRRKAS